MTPALPSLKLGAYLVRTSFGQDQAWHEIVERVLHPQHFVPGIQPVNGEAFAGAEIRDILPLLPDRCAVVFVADEESMLDPRRPLLAVSNRSDSDPPLRVTASAACEMENNLSVVNLDWEDFYAGARRSGGVFDGFVTSPGDPLTAAASDELPPPPPSPRPPGSHGRP